MATAARLATASVALFLSVTSLHAAEAEQGWPADANGCKFRVPSDMRRVPEKLTWDGACVDGFIDGKGTADLEGVIYEGEFKRGLMVSGEVRFGTGSYKGELQDNMPAGRGVMRMPDGTVVEGTFRRGEVVGVADVTWTNGARYHGEVIDHTIMHGAGKITHANGATYEGPFSRGEYHGKGEATWPDGSRYSGHYEFGKEHGTGTLVSADGTVYEGEWVSGRRQGKGKTRTADGTVCSGDYVADYIQGKGRCDYADGAWQEGEYKNGKLSGQCKVQYATKESYSGECLNGEPSGRGHFENPADGTIYDGELIANKFHGQGRLTRPGYAYEGQFMSNLANGRGKEILESGEQYEGDFARGVREGNGTLTLTKADGTVGRYQGAFKQGHMHGQGEFTTGKTRFAGEFKRGVFAKGRIHTEEGRVIEADIEANVFFEVKPDGSKVPIDSQLPPEPQA